MGNSNEGIVGWLVGCLVPFTQMETRHFPAELPTSPHKTDKIQDCHNVAMTSSMDTQVSGIDTSPRPLRCQPAGVAGTEGAANVPLEWVPAVSAGVDAFHTGCVPKTGCSGASGLSGDVTFHLGPINNSAGRMHKLGRDATKLHT